MKLRGHISFSLSQSRGGRRRSSLLDLEKLRRMQQERTTSSSSAGCGGIRAALADDLHATLADPGQVESAILNLAINARDAMPDGGELTFETEVVKLDHEFCRYHPEGISAGNYIVISIADKGCGMDAETQKHIFEPFYTSRASGTGLGLAVVKLVAKAHQGDVWLESEEGQGCRFGIRLPVIGKKLAQNSQLAMQVMKETQ